MGAVKPHDERLAEAVLIAALHEGRAGELLDCLLDGGSCTIDQVTGLLTLASRDQLASLLRPEDPGIGS
jgi:hypothetical protein